MEERAALCHLPAETEEEKATFVSYLDFLLRRYFGEKAVLIPAVKDPPWEDLNRIPDFVRVMSEKAGGGVTSQEWRRWNSYQRYALLKLTSSKNEPELFFQALKEFRSSRGERE